VNHVHSDGGPVRASDAERDQAAEILRAGYAEGRLTRAELDERLTAAYAAKTRAGLRDLTGDLPGAGTAPAAVRPAIASLPLTDDESGTGPGPDPCLLLCLLCAFPTGRHRLLDPGRPPPATGRPPTGTPAARHRVRAMT
jgi:hypothetical protein